MSEAESGPTPIDELLARALDGDMAAINEILERLRPWMKRLASEKGPHGGAVSSSDVVQDAQLKAFQNLPKFRGTTIGEFCRWLQRIVEREAIDDGTKQKKERARQKALPEDSSGQVIIQAPEESPEHEVIRNDALETAMARLSHRDQFVIHLRDFLELSFAEIATVLETTAANARQLHGRAMKRLGGQLGE